MSSSDENSLMGRPPRDDHFLFGDPSTPTHAPDVLHGLRPRHLSDSTETSGVFSEWGQRTMRGGLPLLMTGSLAAGVGVTSSMPAIAQPEAQPEQAEGAVSKMKSSLSELLHQAFVPLSQRVVNSVAPHVPDTYRVQAGDTITSVAEKFGLPTTVVLTLNGLSWNSILHEGQVVRLTMAPSKQRGAAPTRVSAEGYTVQPGDTLAAVAERLGISERALAEANGLQPGTPLTEGRSLRLPGTAEQLAPRVVPAATQSAPRIVFASANDQTRPSEAGDTVESSSSDQQADSEADEASDAEPQVITDPLSAEILDAPELRPEKKAAPPPPPQPAPAPAPKPEQRDEDEDEGEERDKQDDSAEEASSGSTVGQPISGAITPLNDVRRKNASTIVQVGRDMGIPDYGIVIALATAMQESSLRNIDWGDRDSVGLFQQRPSSGWGSVEQIMDPVFATRAFFGGPDSPTPGRTRGLLDISGWQSMELTVAAQRVQISAYPNAYAKWEASAWAWLEELS